MDSRDVPPDASPPPGAGGPPVPSLEPRAPGARDEARRYAGAIWTLVRTDFKARYHGTLMGFLWALLKPLVVVITLLLVFQFAFPNTPHYAANLLAGIFLYDLFSDGTRTGLISLHSKGYLLSKSRFPRWILVVTSLANPLITFTTASAGVVVFLYATGTGPGPLQLVLFVLYALQLVLVVAGISLAASVLFVRYRDLNQVWEVLTHAGFFAAPVIYPLSMLPERLHVYLYLWPPTAFIQFSRAVLIDQAVPSLKGHLLMVGLTGTILLAGALIHRRLASTAAEYL
jgi:ABC-type polysaccharide/polyol phosphate export permease